MMSLFFTSALGFQKYNKTSTMLIQTLSKLQYWIWNCIMMFTHWIVLYGSPSHWHCTAQFNMGGLWKEVNDFFTSTSIHGFPYISNINDRSTRIIWTIILFIGFGVTTFFLYETIDGFNEKYVTTTVHHHEFSRGV